MKAFIVALLLAVATSAQAQNADCLTLAELAERVAYSRDAGVSRSDMVAELFSGRDTIPAPTMKIAVAIIKWVYTDRPPARDVAATVFIKCEKSK